MSPPSPEAAPVLPPDLVLPSMKEASRFRLEVFNHGNHTAGELVELGGLVVARSVQAASDTRRINFAPTKGDFDAAYDDGYGVGYKFLQRQGGPRMVQREQGFCPVGYKPSLRWLLERLQWFVDDPLTAAGIDPADGQLRETLSWGIARGVLPSLDIIDEVLIDDRPKLFAILSRENPQPITASYLDAYRFAAQVIENHNGPVRLDTLDQQYRIRGSVPRSVIAKLYGESPKLWSEFGYITRMSGLSAQDIVSLGVQYVIQRGRNDLTASTIAKLSKAQRFVNYESIYPHFTIPEYRKAVNREYAAYGRVLHGFRNRGITSKVINLACRNFENTPDFKSWLKSHVPEMVKLSRSDSSKPHFYEPAAEDVVLLIRNGLNLLDNKAFSIQWQSLQEALDELEFDNDQRAFVYDLIPRLDAEEAQRPDFQELIDRPLVLERRQKQDD